MPVIIYLGAQPYKVILKDDLYEMYFYLLIFLFSLINKLGII